MMKKRICPIRMIGVDEKRQMPKECWTECAWYNPYADQCAIFLIADQVADVAQRVDELRDVIEDGVKVCRVKE